MGMDGVEIVMTVEERFGIEISNPEAEQIVTPGELIDLVLRKVTTSETATCPSRRAFHAVRRALIMELNCNRNTVRQPRGS